MTAAYIKNRSPTRGLSADKIPFEVLNGFKPSVAHLRRFGSPCSVKDLMPGQGKLSPRSWDGIFIGYAHNKRAWRVWDPTSRQVFMARDVIFNEDGTGNPRDNEKADPHEDLSWNEESDDFAEEEAPQQQLISENRGELKSLKSL